MLSTQKELGTTNHLKCDWLINYFDMRKEARDGEIDALGKAKAVLGGTDLFLAKHVGVQKCRMHDE